MSGVFICYRRGAASFVAGRLSDVLVSEFGTDCVFMDVDAIEPGLDFLRVVEHAVETCDVLLAVIDPTWLSSTDDAGRRRLDDPEDVVRFEIATALRRDVRVVPVLALGATMPRREDLPEDLAPLARRNAIVLTHARWHADMQPLVAVLQRELGAGPAEVGRIYEGKVVDIKEFGAFVELFPGMEALCHVSELDDEYVNSPDDVVQLGDRIRVKCIHVDPSGRVKVSRKAVIVDEKRSQ